jgi:copper(I)-binding protein
MLMNLKKPLAAGDKVPLKLVVESGGKRQIVEVDAEARAPGGSAMPHQHH